MDTLNREQSEYSKAFFAALYASYHGHSDHFDSAFWAAKLDELRVSWAVQNRIAGAASVRNNGFLYLRNVFAKLDIQLT